MWRIRLAQGLTLAAGAIAFLVFANWLAFMPAPAKFVKNTYPLFVELFVGSREKYPVSARIGIVFIAINGLVATGLSLFLALKSWTSDAPRYLSSSLAAGALTVAYFYFLSVYPEYQLLIGWNGSLLLAMTYDTAGFMLAGFAAFAMLRFMALFPSPISVADWERHLLTLFQRSHATISAGWRRYVYPKRFLDAAQLTALGDNQEIASLYGYGKYAHERAKFFGILISNRPLQLFLLLAPILAAFHYIVRLHLAESPGSQPLPGWLVVLLLASSFVMALQIMTYAIGFEILSYHKVNGTEAERRRIDWFYSTFFVVGATLISLFVGGFSLFVLLVLLAGEELAGYPLLLLIVWPIIIGMPFMTLAILVSLALSILYRGAIDPRLVARKITVWWVLGVVVTFLFILVERALALKITHWLSMAPETGPLIAGALVAATVSPIRGRTEKVVNLFASRYLPIHAVIGGERKVVSVAMSDLSGYTSRSAQDEKQALLLAALLQQQAARVADTHRGRVVKSMGDAVMMEFASAHDACSALDALHAAFPVAARAIGIPPLALHSGAHHGEVTVGPDEDLYGQTVNLAARLQGIAIDNQIVLSDRIVAAALLGAEKIESLGSRVLKNIPESVPCYALRQTSHSISISLMQ